MIKIDRARAANDAFIQQLLKRAAQRQGSGMGGMAPQQAPLPQPPQPTRAPAQPILPDDTPAYAPPNPGEMNTLEEVEQTIKDLQEQTGRFAPDPSERKTWLGERFQHRLAPATYNRNAARINLRTPGTPEHERYLHELMARGDALRAAQAQRQAKEQAQQNQRKFNLLQGLTPGVSPVSELEEIMGSLQNVPASLDLNKIPTTEAMRRAALSRAGAMMDPKVLSEILSKRQGDLQSRELHPYALRDKELSQRLKVSEEVRRQELHGLNFQQKRIANRKGILDLNAWVPDRAAKDAAAGIAPEISQKYWVDVWNDSLDPNSETAKAYAIFQGLAGGTQMNMRLIQDAAKLIESATGNTKDMLEDLVKNRVGQVSQDMEMWPKIKTLSSAHNIPTYDLLAHADHIPLMEQMAQDNPRLSFRGIYKIASKNPEKFYQLMQSKAQTQLTEPSNVLRNLVPDVTKPGVAAAPTGTPGIPQDAGAWLLGLNRTQ